MRSTLSVRRRGAFDGLLRIGSSEVQFPGKGVDAWRFGKVIYKREVVRVVFTAGWKDR